MHEYTNLLIALGLVFFALLASLRRELAFYVIILLLPAYQIRFQIFGFPATFLEGMILILALVEFGARILPFLRKPDPQMRILSYWVPQSAPGIALALIFLFLLAALASVFTAPNLVKAAGIFKAYFFEAAVFYFLTLLIIDTPKKINRLFKTFALLVLSLSIFGIYQFFTLYGLPYSWWAVGVESRRIISVLNHPNGLALLLGPVIAMLIMLPRKTKLHWIAILAGIITLYFSFSRAAWLALAITIAVFILLSWRGERKREGLKLLFLIIVIGALIFTVPFSRAKILDLARGQDLSQQNRYVLWSAAADILKKSPILGTGLMGFHEAYKNYPLGPDRVVQNYPHNFFLNFWVETGLLGLVSMLGLLILFFKKIWEQTKNSDSRALPAAAGMAMIILHGLVDASYFKNDLSVLFWLIYAIPFLEIKK